MLKIYWRLVFRPCWSQILFITASIFLTSTLDVVSIGLIVPLVGMLIGPETNAYPWATRVAENAVAAVGLGGSRLAIVAFGMLVLVALVAAKNAVMLLQTVMVQRLSA